MNVQASFVQLARFSAARLVLCHVSL
jgi:hypothetical protein